MASIKLIFGNFNVYYKFVRAAVCALVDIYLFSGFSAVAFARTKFRLSTSVLRRYLRFVPFAYNFSVAQVGCVALCLLVAKVTIFIEQ